jgi:hydroxymethylglutaryl-CoA reductase
MNSADFSGFYKKTVRERQSLVKKEFQLSDTEEKELTDGQALGLDLAERMIENVVGRFELPLGLATNFLINGKEKVIPMAIEEASVVAAASNAAKLCRSSGGFFATASEPIMVGQIQLVQVKDLDSAKEKILKHKKELIALGNTADPLLVKFGGGVKDIEVKELQGRNGSYLIVQVLVNVQDAMGANAVNTICEKLTPRLEELSQGIHRVRILSNYAVHRTVNVDATWKKEELGGRDVIEKMLDVYELAKSDVFRACTHNKGIMNGIDAVVMATGNDCRAVEAGAHAYASRNGRYESLSVFEKTKKGDLKVSMEIPMAVGIVGGTTKVHPVAQLSLKMLGVKKANELAEVIACVGLANNVAAVKALATVGIQKGHMRLHAKNIAMSAGAKGKDIDRVASEMVKRNEVRMDVAEDLLGKK